MARSGTGRTGWLRALSVRLVLVGPRVGDIVAEGTASYEISGSTFSSRRMKAHATARLLLLLLAVAVTATVSPSLQLTLTAEEEAYLAEQRQWIEEKRQEEGMLELPCGIPYRIVKVWGQHCASNPRRQLSIEIDECHEFVALSDEDGGNASSITVHAYLKTVLDWDTGPVRQEETRLWSFSAIRWLRRDNE